MIHDNFQAYPTLNPGEIAALKQKRRKKIRAFLKKTSFTEKITPGGLS